MVKLHLGCGSNILDDYMNIDYFKFNPIQTNVRNGNASDLKLIGYGAETVDKIFHQHFIEHLDFWEEKKAWDSWYYVLKNGGELEFDVLDFEWICKKFLDAEDNWKQFYEAKDNDYFGNGLNYNQRWGVLIAHFFGNAAHPGQYHKNGYTEKKLINMLKYYNYSKIDVSKFTYEKFGELQCLKVKAIK